MYEILFLIFFISGASILFHELGHIVVMSYILKEKIPVKMKWTGLEVGTDEQISRLNLVQYNRILFFGVLMGLLPIILVSYILSPWFSFMLFLAYFLASSSDLKQMAKKH